MTPFYYIEMLEKSKQEENCDLEEEDGDSLSLRMQNLNSKLNSVKSLASLEQLQSEGALYQGAHTSPLNPQNKQQATLNIIKKSKRADPTSTLKKTAARSASKKKKDNYSIEDGKMFEMMQAKEGRMAMVKEMQYMRVREFSGRGLLVFPNGKKFEGYWVDGQLIGKAKITHTNGDVYIGDTYSFQRHGRGTLHFASGQRYEGEFSSGDFHGQGTLFDVKGKVIYEGEWRRGKKFDK